MDIRGNVPSVCLDQALSWSSRNLPNQYHNIIEFYQEQGEYYGIRWDWAFAQACHETGYFEFGGDVQPEQNNFAGIGATGDGNPGESFQNISDGVKAQIQHLACYAGVDIPEHELIANRTREVKAIILNRSTTWEGLAGTWAMDAQYFQKLQYHYHRIFEPREQEHGWYRLVESEGKKFFVAMSGGDPIFKYSVADHKLATLREVSDKLLEIFPDALNVHCDTEMDLTDIPVYEPGIPNPESRRNPWNDISAEEPPYFWRRSPNKSSRGESGIEYIILHNTAGSFAGAVSWLCNPQSGASAHLVIPRSGAEIAALVNENDAAWHAGSRRWNRCSIGIEIECANHQRGMTEAQEKLVVQQINHLLIKYNLTPDKIDIHRRVSRSPLPDQPASSGSARTTCPVLIWPTDQDFFNWRQKWYNI
ncbi:MAG: hypothetical protein GVY04_06195 [Cyanobacteria bacterium]|jgi:hypothetical protein|nr:hypothetical protein [Cyanobacteria bacterium GSL.Bin1]